MTRRSPESLRSARWFAPDDLRSFGHRSRIMQMGYAPEDWAGKPVIGIVNTWSDAWKFWDERRAGTIGKTEWIGVEAGIARSHGTCMTMGTAATMMGIAEAIGMTLPGASAIPAPDANHVRMAAASGRRIVDM